jgi:hypothetical protein
MFLDENLDDDVIKMDTERILEQRLQKIDELVNQVKLAERNNLKLEEDIRGLMDKD